MAEQRSYEIVFIINPDTPAEDVARLSEGFQQIITDQGGEIVKTEDMGRRKLAYPIERKTEGIYVLFEVAGSGREIAELERRMRVSDLVIRYMTVRVDEDRKRAEKFREQRARKASKRPQSAAAGAGGGGGGRGGSSRAPVAVEEDEA